MCSITAKGKKILVAVFFALLLTVPFVAKAQVTNESVAEDTFGIVGFGEKTLLAKTDIRIIIANIIRVVLGLLGVITVGLILYAGYLIMTSAGNEDKISQGRKVMLNAVVGLTIILASLAIVQFVLSALENAILSRVDEANSGRGPRYETFAASGALGRIVKDHYPERNEKDVKRNTKIIVTFREPILASSLISNFNGNNAVGDCIMPANEESFRWGVHCDRANTSSVKIYEKRNPNVLMEAAAEAVPEGAEGKNYTFVFKPLADNGLGSSLEDVDYVVELTNNITKDDGQNTPAFKNEVSGKYLWEFQTGTDYDTRPPVVESIFPNQLQEVARNSIIQINFSEAMDPTMVQGRTGAAFYNIIFGTTTPSNVLPSGEWRVTNGYRTVEFVSDSACGQNSCGDTMYCIQMDCANPSSPDCYNDYRVLIRTAFTLSTDPRIFEARPRSGVMDVAGNALDTKISVAAGVVTGGNETHPVPSRPNPADPAKIGDNELYEDNFRWEFSVKNDIDRTVPFISSVEPYLDAESVSKNALVRIAFNRVMWLDTLANIRLEEYPARTNGVDPLWFVPRSRVVDTHTVMNMDHREFGPNAEDLYYFPAIPSTIKALNQNCMYPGRGPVANQDERNANRVCRAVEITENGQTRTEYVDCVDVNGSNLTDTGCIQTTNVFTNGTDARRQPNVQACLDFLGTPDVSRRIQTTP